MNILEALILGIVQGLTEFLPVSSSGHLVIFERLMGVGADAVYFNIAVHFATLVAVCIALWEEVVKIIKKPFGKMTWLLITATIPAAVAGVLLNDLFDEISASGITVGIGLLITGAVLLATTRPIKNTRGLEEVRWHDALIAGIAQAIAIVPGISRSGMTIGANLSLSMKREFAVKFAFLMSIPVILGGFLLETYQLVSGTAASLNPAPVAAGMIAAGIAGYFAIRFFIKTVMKGNLKWFAVYVFAVAALVFADQLFFGMVFDKIF